MAKDKIPATFTTHVATKMYMALRGITVVECEKCRGRGHVQKPYGFFALSAKCPDCDGYGKQIRGGDPNHIEDALKEAEA